MRGSRKHVLDLVTHRPAELAALVDGSGFVLRQPLVMRPVSHEQPAECTLRQFCKEYLPAWTGFGDFDRWWVPEEYTNPTWDLLALGEQGDRPGLLLVEAKAHEGELDRNGKRLGANASAQSRQNHERIRGSIAGAAEGLSRVLERRVGISIDTHYQLSNRIASAYALAASGLPVVLLYLGFTGDVYFKSDYLVDAAHWQRAVKGYLDGVMLGDIEGRVMETPPGGSVTFIVKCLPVESVSMPR